MNILNINIFDYKLVRPDEIYNKENSNYKMYSIISCEKMFFTEPEISENKLFIKFKNSDGFHWIVETAIETNEDITNLYIKSDFPCEVMQINDLSISASEIYLTSNCFDRKMRIEYIGISTKDSETRLRYHSTFQKIQSTFLGKHINRDLYIILFNAVHFEMKIMDDIGEKAEKLNDNDFLEYLNNSYENEKVITALAEAILINLFKPEYNIEYKNTICSYNFRTLKSLYEYGFTEGAINIFLKENDSKFKTILYTETLTLEFSNQNLFKISKKCPFFLKTK